MNDPTNITDAQRERLYLLTEECAEVIKEAQKLLRFGMDSYHPDTGIMSIDLLTQEIGDLSACIGLLVASHDVSKLAVEKATARKIERLKQYTFNQGDLL